MLALPLITLILMIFDTFPFGQAKFKPSNETNLRELVVEYDSCMLQSLYTFMDSRYYPPTTMDQLEESCKSQAQGLKCIKEKIKTAPALVKSGLATFVLGRQRHFKKICTDLNSDKSQQFVKELRCIMDKKLTNYSKLDIDMANTIVELVKKNFDDAAKELKYLCCAAIKFRKAYIDNVRPQCNSSRAEIEDMITSIVPNELSYLCDDDQKVITKICPKLEPLNLPNSTERPKDFGPSTTLYLILTLGEAEVVAATALEEKLKS